MKTKEQVSVRRVVLLGHSGFIGSHLYESLSATLPGVELVGYSFPELDLTRSASVGTLKTLLNRQTVVIVCSGIKRQFGDSLDIFEKNVAMCLNVARSLEISPVARLIFFSSLAVYGEDIHNLAISESTVICPRSYYGLAKYTGEQIFERVFSRLAGTFVAIRPALIYGFGDEGNTYGPVGFLKAALGGRSITLWGDGKELREFIYIDDITAMVTRLVTSQQHGVVNIAAGQSYSFRDVLDIISKLFPRGIQVDSRPRSKDKVDNVVVNNKLLEWLNDFRFTPLEEGIKKMYMLERTCT